MEETKSMLIFTYGFPAAGKTTYSLYLYEKFKKEGVDVVLISADKIREELYGSQDCFGDSITIYKTILERMIWCAIEGKSVIYDATNLRKDYRMDYLMALADANVLNKFNRKIIIKINTDKKPVLNVI